MNWARKLADAIKNDVVGGLRGYHTNLSMSTQQLEEECVQYRLAIIKEYMIKGVLPISDLLFSLNCIPVDCEDLTKCPCSESTCGKPQAHFQIPQLLFDYGLNKAIRYIGSTDKQNSFLVYTKPIDKINTFKKYRKRGRNKPWVYIDVTPNAQGFLDCYIFGAPLIKEVSVQAIFKDPRQLENFSCNCKSDSSDENLNFIDILIKERLTKLKLQYYRQYQPPTLPNTQEYVAG